MWRVLFFLTLVAIATKAQRLNPGASRGPKNVPIATTPPRLPAGNVVAPDAIPGPFLTDFRKPYPTNTWWSGFTLGKQESTAAGPFPFQSKTTSLGFQFGISGASSRQFDGTSIKQFARFDWLASFVGLPNTLSNRKATSWDTQTVCLQYANGDATMDTCLIPGSPYMTFTYKNARVQLTSLMGQTASFSWVTQGSKGKLTNGGGTYNLYVISGTLGNFDVSGKVLTSSSPFTGTIRLAKVNETSQEAILDTYSKTYATGLTMNYAVTGDAAKVTWTWNVVGTAQNLLLLSWPHHRKLLQSPTTVNIQYLTTKGYMKGVSGNQWVLNYDLPKVSWFTTKNPQASCSEELIKTLEYEVNALKPRRGGSYYRWGGASSRDSQLATIAEQLGRTDLVNKVVTVLKQSLEFVLNANSTAAYETGWGGFVQSNDKLNLYFNDHHFVFGYLLHAAAVIGKYDPSWLAANIDFITHVARDIGNPSHDDPYYTFTRHMDFFAGHSWASGLLNSAGPRNQESSSEAINGYYGLLLFAHTTKNVQLINYARLLLAIEMHGAKTYWHLYPKRNDPDTPYPEQGLRDLVTIGNVYDTQAGAFILWGSQYKTQIAGIEILPLTPIGEYFYDKEWVAEVVPYAMQELQNVTIGDAFKSVIYPAYAMANPQEAYSYSTNIIDWGSGNSATNSLYFISTRDSTMNICTGVSHTPEGDFNIQDADTGKYVTVAGETLAANVGLPILATKFTLAFIPGGGTIKALSSNKFLTASPQGNRPLAAARVEARAFEIFRWKQNADGTFTLTAMANRKTVRTDPKDNRLINDAGTSRYRLLPANNALPAIIPRTGTLKSVSNGRFVEATGSDKILRATQTSKGTGTIFKFDQVQSSSANPPYYTIQSSTTNLYVTGNPEGTSLLAATKTQARGWEYFQIYSHKNAYVIVHVASGKAVSVQSTNTLIANSSGADNSALFVIG